MYILQQSDFDVFNSIKQNHISELAKANIDVEPISCGTYNGMSFTPNGTYSVDITYFSPGSENFYNDLVGQGFFDNLQQK